MTLYTTRNPHKTAMRHHHFNSVQPAEKQPHPSDDRFYLPLWAYMLAGTFFVLGFSWGASL